MAGADVGSRPLHAGQRENVTVGYESRMTTRRPLQRQHGTRGALSFDDGTARRIRNTGARRATFWLPVPLLSPRVFAAPGARSFLMSATHAGASRWRARAIGDRLSGDIRSAFVVNCGNDAFGNLPPRFGGTLREVVAGFVDWVAPQGVERRKHGAGGSAFLRLTHSSA